MSYMHIQYVSRYYDNTFSPPPPFAPFARFFPAQRLPPLRPASNPLGPFASIRFIGVLDTTCDSDPVDWSSVPVVTGVLGSARGARNDLLELIAQALQTGTTSPWCYPR